MRTRPTLSIRAAGPLLGASFVSGGWNSLRNPGPLTAVAADAGIPLPQLAVKTTSAAMLVAGTALAVGRAPAASAATLAVCLAGATYGVHPFWKEQDQAARRLHRNAFLSNAGLLGGLVLVIKDQRSRR